MKIICQKHYDEVVRYSDGSLGIVGGLVYHGTPDRSGCYTMNYEDLWQTHM